LSSSDVELPDTVDEFARACADRQSVYKGLQYFVAKGRMGELADAMRELAENVTASGYVAPVDRKEYERLTELAKSVSDKELARYYREKAARIREQLGEAGAR